MVDGIAYWRNPLRRKRGQGRSTRPQAGPGIIDVSAAAKKNKRTAVWRLAVQFIGLSFAAYGADVFWSITGTRTWSPGWPSSGQAAGSSVPLACAATTIARSWPGHIRSWSRGCWRWPPR